MSHFTYRSIFVTSGICSSFVLSTTKTRVWRFKTETYLNGAQRPSLVFHFFSLPLLRCVKWQGAFGHQLAFFPPPLVWEGLGGGLGRCKVRKFR